MEAYPRRPWERRDGLVAAGAMKTPLAWIGAFALLLWTGGGLLAWALAKERVSLVVEQGERERTPPEDGLAELSRRIDEQALERRALGEVLEQNFAVLDERSEARAAALEQALAAARDEVAEIARALEETRAELAATADADHAAPSEPVAAATEAAAAPTPELEAPAAPTGPLPTAAEPAQTRAEPRRSFLAFQLPEDDFRFDERRSWVVVPSQSRVGFDAKSTLHDFSGTTSQVAGELAFELSRPDEDPRGEIRVEAAGLDTGNADRDQDMRQHLDTAGHPEIRFHLERFEPAAIDAEQAAVHGTAHGTMRIRGVERALAMPVRASVDASRRLLLEGQVALSLRDYGVPVPSKLGVISMEPEVVVWIALRARLEARVEARIEARGEQ
jgi:polyisoprenoid-binding protein YceI